MRMSLTKENLYNVSISSEKVWFDEQERELENNGQSDLVDNQESEESGDNYPQDDNFTAYD